MRWWVAGVVLLAGCRKPAPALDSDLPPPAASENRAPPPAWTASTVTAQPTASAPPPCVPPTSCAAVAFDSAATITLTRNGCFGTCPQYDLTIHASGAIEWWGVWHVDVQGPAKGKLTPAEVAPLFKHVSKSCFFEACPLLGGFPTDQEALSIEVKTGGRARELKHPTFAIVAELTEQIEKVTHAKKWVGRGGSAKQTPRPNTSKY